MIVHVMALMLAAAVALAVSRPSSAQCPRGWSLNEGIRRDGSFACWGPLERGCGEPVGPDIPCKRPPITRGRIYCTGGSVAIVVDERTVGCQARH